MTKMNYSFYRRYNKPTMFIASVGKCGYRDYLECQIWFNKELGMFEYLFTDAYKYLGITKSESSLKDVIKLFNNYTNKAINSL